MQVYMPHHRHRDTIHNYCTLKKLKLRCGGLVYEIGVGYPNSAIYVTLNDQAFHRHKLCLRCIKSRRYVVDSMKIRSYIQKKN
uniref:Uncharacterized protein n=1 Tax=Solanum tuberosum TaxID=4113 RepID=M1CUF0_SOLTU